VGGRNILAFWTYGWFTFGSAPYLDLPAIGGDTHNRSGRGYTAGRYQGKNQLYGEAEYRMSLSADGMWGAVAFLNVSSFTDPNTGRFDRVDPGIGLGLRVKFNKRSGTNIALDYGWGNNGSRAFYLNLEEAF